MTERTVAYANGYTASVRIYPTAAALVRAEEVRGSGLLPVTYRGRGFWAAGDGDLLDAADRVEVSVREVYTAAGIV